LPTQLGDPPLQRRQRDAASLREALLRRLASLELGNGRDPELTSATHGTGEDRLRAREPPCALARTDTFWELIDREPSVEHTYVRARCSTKCKRSVSPHIGGTSRIGQLAIRSNSVLRYAEQPFDLVRHRRDRLGVSGDVTSIFLYSRDLPLHKQRD